MRHLKSGRKLGMSPTHRKAMFRNMVTSLMLHGQIRTTETRAKELRRIADKLITLGKRVPPSALASLDGDDLAKARAKRVHAIRQVRRWVNDREALDKVFNEYAERFEARPGGYTAPMNVVSLMPADTADEAPVKDDAGADALDEVEALASQAEE